MALSRSEQMARIRATRTVPELRLRSALWARSIRMSLHQRTPHGRPDLVLRRARLAVFVDGCFWHGCPDHYVRPRTRCDFWAGKLRGNVERDRRQTLGLEKDGWTVIRIWEHEVESAVQSAARRIAAAAEGRGPRRTIDWRAMHVDPVDAAAVRERWTLVDLRDPRRVRELVRTRSTTHAG